MADLELLSNEDLRAKLLEHGLGSIPLTATTRKVLVNKLRKVMNGEVPPPTAPAADKKTSRRETMHVSKPAAVPAAAADEKVEQKKMSKRRATLDAGSAPPPPIVGPLAAAAGPSDSRRSGGTTPVPKTKETRSVVAEPTTYVILDEDEERVNKPPVDIPPPITRAKRSSRSPSLGKSDTVTTSYQSVSAAVANKIAAPIEELEQSEDDDQLSYFPQNSNKPAADTRHIHNIVFNPEPRAISSVAPRRQTTFPSIVPSFSRPETVRTPDINRRRVTAAAADFRYTPPNYSGLAANSDSDDADLDLEISAGDTPYLSDFAKRLSCLRAEPLSVGAGTTSQASAYSSRDWRTNPEVTSRSRISAVTKQATVDDSLWQSFKLLLVSLERKMRPVLLLAFFVLVAIFIYVFFFTNN